VESFSLASSGSRVTGLSTYLRAEDTLLGLVGSKCRSIREALVREGLYCSDPGALSGNNSWRVGVSPFPLTQSEYAFLQGLGAHLLAFYRAVNRLYLDSLHGHAPDWVARYLDQGKPETVVAYGRMNRFRQHLPTVIRPDLILGDNGMIATELDAVPGGIGLTGCLSAAYAAVGGLPIGGASGMVAEFARMIRSLVPNPRIRLAIVVSDESAAYRPEMAWLARALRGEGITAMMTQPAEIRFTEEGLWVEEDGPQRVDVLYRFFELFDLKNIPKAELMLYAVKKRQVVMIPPAKAHLEEKSLFALFHHPVLAPFWGRQLGEETVTVLRSLFPKTWIMDPAHVPPHAVIPGLSLRGQPISDFRQMGNATQKERGFVIKPSGFSELAWGSRGVSVGQDLSEMAWNEVIQQALAQFPKTPSVLQVFHKGKKVVVTYYDFDQGCPVEMEGRVRLSPYYYVHAGEASLGGVLATVCSAEKKLIHGMADAVMTPCEVS